MKIPVRLLILGLLTFCLPFTSDQAQSMHEAAVSFASFTVAHLTSRDRASVDSPLPGWNLCSLDMTDGGPPTHCGCPCLGDAPPIGAETYGTYINTNEFSTFGGQFSGAHLFSAFRIYPTLREAVLRTVLTQVISNKMARVQTRRVM